ncbi:MAG: glutathione peroxidase [Nocardioidaceae bacterium]
MTTLHDFSAATIDKDERHLSDYRGSVTLVVNTASKCGFTSQYEGLESLYATYAPQGFAVLGFPCDQFGHQEPGDEQEIKSFCATTYDVTFPMFAKVEVNGPGAHPLFGWLQREEPGESAGPIEWNFTKFLVDGDGNVVRRYGPRTEPVELSGEIEQLLAAE